MQDRARLAPHVHVFGGRRRLEAFGALEDAVERQHPSRRPRRLLVLLEEGLGEVGS